ncbi:MAG: hypothetical protein D6726_00815 [Nitrospirae bacterium]|nr:MAG: hypothetical protein D6726_00815 [Nitrospirota bacterium]
MKRVLDILLSIKTAFSIMNLFILFAFLGSIIFPRNLAFFSGIDETPLFKWLATEGKIGITWWIYALILSLALLGINTVFCTADAFLRRLSRRNLLLKLSPQIMHIGVLFVMLGHLLTAATGLKEDILLEKGKPPVEVNGLHVRLDDLDVKTDEEGYDIDWRAVVEVDGKEGKRQLQLRPSRPVYYGSVGFFIQAATKDETEVSALVRLTVDPGALWALLGGILLSLGGMGFIYSRFSMVQNKR